MDGVDFTVLNAAASGKVRAEVAAAESLIPAGTGVNLPLISAYMTHRLYTPAEATLQQALKDVSSIPKDACSPL